MGMDREEFVGNPIRPDEQGNDDEIVSEDELEVDLLGLNGDPNIDPAVMILGKPNTDEQFHKR